MRFNRPALFAVNTFVAVASTKRETPSPFLDRSSYTLLIICKTCFPAFTCVPARFPATHNWAVPPLPSRVFLSPPAATVGPASLLSGRDRQRSCERYGHHCFDLDRKRSGIPQRKQLYLSMVAKCMQYISYIMHYHYYYHYYYYLMTDG